MIQTLLRVKESALRKPASFISFLGICASLAACSSAAGTIDDATVGDVKADSSKSDILKGSDIADAVDQISGDAIDDSADATTVVLPGEFSAPCTDDTDCNSGMCIQVYGGQICSHDCSGNCETGFTCQQVTTHGGDTIFACVPKYKHICDPCNANKDCNDGGDNTNVCIPYGASGSFCGATCDEILQDCPKGYSCDVVLNPATGAKVHQCQHQGICDCSQAAENLQLSTTCSIKNAYGTCTGVRACGIGGLAECTAAVPAQEICNNIDDDCNGLTDDFNDTSKCPITNEFGTCQGIIKQCVNGVALCDGQTPTTEVCNGKDDNCDGQTDEGLCEDGDPCTKDTCNTDGSCQHVQLGGMACDDGSICTQTDKCIAGKCVGGNSMNCDDLDPCTTDSCDPFVGCQHVVASDAACASDGDDCTLDTCKNGTCEHIKTDSLPCQSDGEQCTDDICTGGVCTHVPSTAACDDGNACTVGDMCSGGKCLSGKTPSCDDGNPCTTDTCDPNTVDGCQHTNNDFAACTSSSADCPIGQCAGGQCFPQANKTCSTTVSVDLCQNQTIAGVCTSAGKCVPVQKSQPFSCGGSTCKSICLTCYGVQLCLDFLGSP